MGTDSLLIGDFRPAPHYYLYFAAGVAIGSFLRLGTWLVPSGVVQSVVDLID